MRIGFWRKGFRQCIREYLWRYNTAGSQYNVYRFQNWLENRRITQQKENNR